jgi:hypothetical protein
MVNMLDWNSLFFNHLIKIPELFNSYSSKIKELEDILNKEEWQERISKRGLGFFGILIKLESIVERKVYMSKNIKWTEIPGMKIIIEAINYELKNNNVAYYSDGLIRLLRMFINDYQISNRLFKSIIGKTK